MTSSSLLAWNHTTAQQKMIEVSPLAFTPSVYCLISYVCLVSSFCLWRMHCTVFFGYFEEFFIFLWYGRLWCNLFNMFLLIITNYVWSNVAKCLSCRNATPMFLLLKRYMFSNPNTSLFEFLHSHTFWTLTINRYKNLWIERHKVNAVIKWNVLF